VVKVTTFAFTFSFGSKHAIVSVAFLGCGNNIKTASHGKLSVKQIDGKMKILQMQFLTWSLSLKRNMQASR
jgi:hypothetical protein